MKHLLTGLCCGIAGACFWIVLSWGDAEAGESGVPLVGWELLDGWQLNSPWIFFLVPAAALIVPAVSGMCLSYGLVKLKAKKLDAGPRE